jgi:hypothetical protein
MIDQRSDEVGETWRNSLEPKRKKKLFSILLLISKNCKDHQEEVEEEVSHSPTHVFTKTTIHACHTERRREKKEKILAYH